MKLFSFLFDEDHPELRDLGFVGPPCTGRVVRAAEKRITEPVQLLRGGIIAHTLAYRTTEISLGEKTRREESGISVTTSTFSRAPDANIQAVLIGELYEALTLSNQIKDTDSLFKALSKCTVWAVGIYPVTEELAVKIHNDICSFAPYLGMSEIKLDEPLLYKIFIELMLHNDVIIDGAGLYIKSNDYMPAEDQEDALEIAKMNGSEFKPQALDSKRFNSILPNISTPTDVSSRGKVAIERILKVSKPSQRETLAEQLTDQFDLESDPDGLRFVARAPENGILVEIAKEKLTNYLLNPAHPKGASKAQFFSNVLAIDREDWEFLRDQIERGWEISVLYRVGRNKWGYTHGALMKVMGRNGRSAVLETGWLVSEDGPAQFVTAYPATNTADAPAATPNVVDRSLHAVARWERIFALASERAKSAHDSTVPKPMFLSGYPPVWEGACGYATVTVSNDAAEFSDWLVDGDHAIRRSNDTTISFHSATQSLDRSIASAKAFGEVLGANGILSRVDFFID